ncbi:MAG: hypothetical protein ACE5HA_04710 [Anaerolineae bacterium]
MTTSAHNPTATSENPSRIPHPASRISHPASRIPHPASRTPSLVLLVIISTFLISCSVLGQPGASPTPPPTATPTTAAHRIPQAVETMPSIDETGAEVATVAPEVALSEMYRNTTAGYAFDYPAGWLVDGEGEYVSLQNYRSEDLPPREVRDPDLYKIEFVWIRPAQARTVDEMLGQMVDSLEEPPTDISVNGLRGVRVVVRGHQGDRARVLLLDLNGRVLLVQSWQAGRLFDRITQTLRPLEGAK